MEEIKRYHMYSLAVEKGIEVGMDMDDNEIHEGEWVKWEDVCSLQEEIKEEKTKHAVTHGCWKAVIKERDAALKKLEWAEEIVIGIGGFEKMDNTIPGRQARKYLDSKRQALKDVNPGNGR